MYDADANGADDDNDADANGAGDDYELDDDNDADANGADDDYDADKNSRADLKRQRGLIVAEGGERGARLAEYCT